MKLGRSRALERIPFQAGGTMLDPTKIRDHIASLKGREKQRAVAVLHCYYSGPQLMEMLGVKKSYIGYAVNQHPDILQAAAISRNMMISDMCEHKMIELLQGMDVGKIEDHRKPQAVKYLADSMDITKQHSKTPEERGTENVAELIFRIQKRSLENQKKSTEEITDAIDITNDVQVSEVILK